MIGQQGADQLFRLGQLAGLGLLHRLAEARVHALSTLGGLDQWKSIQADEPDGHFCAERIHGSGVRGWNLESTGSPSNSTMGLRLLILYINVF